MGKNDIERSTYNTDNGGITKNSRNNETSNDIKNTGNGGTDNATDEKQRQELIHKLRQEIESCQEAIDLHQSRIRSAIVRIRKARLSQVIPTPAVRKQAEAMGPMDNLFFNKIGEDKEAIGEVISAIMGVGVYVEEAIPQYYITNIMGRSVQLDSFAILKPMILIKGKLKEDSRFGPKGAYVDIEVQKEDNDDHEFRVYYNGASMIVNKSEKNTNFKELPRAVVIFISSFDVFNKGKMIYKTKLVTGEDNSIEVRRPVTEYYVNTKITESDTPYKKKIAKLMKLFSNPDEYDFKEFPYFSQRKNELKNTKEGREDMSRELQEFVDNQKKEAAEKAAEEEKRKTLVASIENIMSKLKYTVEQAMDLLSIPQDQRTIYAGLVENS